MSRIAKLPIKIPDGVSIKINDFNVTVQGKNGCLTKKIHRDVTIRQEKNILIFGQIGNENSIKGWMYAGTCRAVIQSMIVGVTVGFQKKLKLFGVGYRISLEKDHSLKMFLGFSHPVLYILPQSIEVKILSQNEILLTGLDKQLVGQVAANIRSYRIPEPYKGKGIRYENENIRIKEAKKK